MYVVCMYVFMYMYVYKSYQGLNSICWQVAVFRSKLSLGGPICMYVCMYIFNDACMYVYVYVCMY